MNKFDLLPESESSVKSDFSALPEKSKFDALPDITQDMGAYKSTPAEADALGFLLSKIGGGVKNAIDVADTVYEETDKFITDTIPAITTAREATKTGLAYAVKPAELFVESMGMMGRAEIGLSPESTPDIDKAHKALAHGLVYDFVPKAIRPADWELQPDDSPEDYLMHGIGRAVGSFAPMTLAYKALESIPAIRKLGVAKDIAAGIVYDAYLGGKPSEMLESGLMFGGVGAVMRGAGKVVEGVGNVFRKKLVREIEGEVEKLSAPTRLKEKLRPFFSDKVKLNEVVTEISKNPEQIKVVEDIIENAKKELPEFANRIVGKINGKRKIDFIPDPERESVLNNIRNLYAKGKENLTAEELSEIETNRTILNALNGKKEGAKPNFLKDLSGEVEAQDEAAIILNDVEMLKNLSVTTGLHPDELKMHLHRYIDTEPAVLRLMESHNINHSTAKRIVENTIDDIRRGLELKQGGPGGLSVKRFFGKTPPKQGFSSVSNFESETSSVTDSMHNIFKKEYAYEESLIKELQRKTREKFNEYMVYMNPVRLQVLDGTISPEQFNLFKGITDSDLREALLRAKSEKFALIEQLLSPISREAKELGLAPKVVRNMERYVAEYFRNKRWYFLATERGKKIPSNLTLSDIRQNISNFEIEIATGIARGDTRWLAIDNSIKNIDRELRAYGKELEAEELLPEGITTINEEYFPFVMLEYMIKDTSFFKVGKIKAPFTGHALEAGGSETKVPSTDIRYVLREYFSSFERARVLKNYKDVVVAEFHKPEMMDKDGNIAAGYAKYIFDYKRMVWNKDKVVGALTDNITMMSGSGTVGDILSNEFQEMFIGAMSLAKKQKEVYILPSSIKNQLDEFYTLNKFDPAWNTIHKITRQWKRNMTRVIGPWSLGFIIRNHVTDGMALLRDDPAAIALLPGAFKTNFIDVGTQKYDPFLKSMKLAAGFENFISKKARSLGMNGNTPFTRVLPDEWKKGWNAFNSFGQSHVKYSEALGFGRISESEYGLYGRNKYLPRIKRTGGTLSVEGPKWQAKGRAVTLEKSYDILRTGLENTFRFARFMSAWKQLQNKIGKPNGVTAEWFEKYGFTEAYDAMGKTLINYGQIPDLHMRWLNNMGAPFWGFFYGNNKAWYNALVKGDNANRARAIAILGGMLLAPEIYNWTMHPDLQEKMTDSQKKWLDYTRNNFYMLTGYEDDNGKSILFGTQTGADTILNELPVRSIARELFNGIYAPDDKGVGRSIGDALFSWAGTQGTLVDELFGLTSPIVKFPIEARSNVSEFSGLPIVDKKLSPELQHLQLLIKVGTTWSRNLNEFSMFMSGNEWMFERMSDLLGEDNAGAIFDTMRMKSVDGPSWLLRGLRWAGLQIKSVNLDRK